LQRISIKLLWFSVFTFTAWATQPVSYSREVASILALNCHACHGANPESLAGGLSTRTWANLNKGGNLGAVVVPGDPEGSPLYQFISGARGEPHRMPLGSPALAVSEVATIGRWIAEGAQEDRVAPENYLIEIPAFRFDRSTPVQVSARVPSSCYLELELADADARPIPGGRRRQGTA
jgi:mono/diheme cytochrome c family protein